MAKRKTMEYYLSVLIFFSISPFRPVLIPPSGTHEQPVRFHITLFLPVLQIISHRRQWHRFWRTTVEGGYSCGSSGRLRFAARAPFL